MKSWDMVSRHIKHKHLTLGFTAWCGVLFVVFQNKNGRYLTKSFVYCSGVAKKRQLHLEIVQILCYNLVSIIITACENVIGGGKMANDNCQKIKLLKLIELLRQETDERHPMTTNEICSRLGAMGISCERRTLTKDIAVLNDQGFEVMWTWVGKEKGYYIEKLINDCLFEAYKMEYNTEGWKD